MTPQPPPGVLDLVRESVDDISVLRLVTEMLHDQWLPIDLPRSASGSQELEVAYQEVFSQVSTGVDRLTPSQQEALWSELGADLKKIYTSSDGLEQVAIIQVISRHWPRLSRDLFSWPLFPSPLFDRYPELMPLDRYGLLEIDRTWGAEAQRIPYRDHIVVPHQGLRRSFGGNLNQSLLRSLFRVWDGESSNVLRLAMDERRMPTPQRHRHLLEEDFLFGPPLSEDTIDDPKHHGLTVHWLVPGSGETFLLVKPYTHFLARWYTEESTGLKVSEMREWVDPEQVTGDLITVRYMHAKRDVKARVFTHCDSRILGYDREEYVQLFGSPTSWPERTGRSRKMWRIDGVVTTNDWSSLVAAWFQGNELTAEYLRAMTDPSDTETANQMADRDAYHRHLGNEFSVATFEFSGNNTPAHNDC